MTRSRDNDSILVECHDRLEQGEKVRMWFESQGKFLSFRSMLYRYKAKLDEILEMSDPGRKVLSLSTTRVDSGELGVIYDFKFNEQKERSSYRFIIIKEDDNAREE